jgi:hypothetical protein
MCERLVRCLTPATTCDWRLARIGQCVWVLKLAGRTHLTLGRERYCPWLPSHVLDVAGCQQSPVRREAARDTRPGGASPPAVSHFGVAQACGCLNEAGWAAPARQGACDLGRGQLVKWRPCRCSGRAVDGRLMSSLRVMQATLRRVLRDETTTF